MLRLIVRRLLLLVPTLIGLSVALFFWVRALPGSPAQALLGERATPALVAEINKQMGLDRPIWEQYLKFIGRALRLDFGSSVQTAQPVLDEIIRRFPATIELGLVGLLFAVAFGIPLGYLAAKRHGTWLDTASITGSLFGITIPVFFLGYLLKYAFAVELGWFPDSGRQDPFLLDVAHPTGFYVLDGIITGNMPAAWDALKHLILPGIALGTIPLAIVTRITRAAVLDVIHEDYVRTAEAKGLTRKVISRRHVLRNALLPVVTVIGLQFGLIMGGAVLTETVFAFNGVGRFVAEAVPNRDYPVIQAFVLVIAVIFTLVNLLVDVSYGLIDPRVRVR